MKVNGREIHFLRTVAANCNIADMCPDGDASKIDALFTGQYQKQQRTCAEFIAVLSDGYEQNKKFAEPGYEPSPISADEALTLPDEDFSALFQEAFTAWRGEKTSIETEPVKSKKKSFSILTVIITRGTICGVKGKQGPRRAK